MFTSSQALTASARSLATRTGIMLLLGALALLTAACTRPASEAPVQVATLNAPRVTINQVHVEQGAGIYIQGSSTLANGECVQTELLVDQQPAPWWPRDVCVQVDSGQWEMLAALGKNGAPEQLSPGSRYAIRAWWSKQPEQTSTRYSFDSSAPTPTP